NGAYRERRPRWLETIVRRRDRESFASASLSREPICLPSTRQPLDSPDRHPPLAIRGTAHSRCRIARDLLEEVCRPEAIALADRLRIRSAPRPSFHLA